MRLPLLPLVINSKAQWGGDGTDVLILVAPLECRCPREVPRRRTSAWSQGLADSVKRTPPSATVFKDCRSDEHLRTRQNVCPADQLGHDAFYDRIPHRRDCRVVFLYMESICTRSGVVVDVR